MSIDIVDAAKDVSSKAFASAGSTVIGLEYVTGTELLSSVDSQLALGLCGVTFIIGGAYTAVDIFDDYLDL